MTISFYFRFQNLYCLCLLVFKLSLCEHLIKFEHIGIYILKKVNVPLDFDLYVLFIISIKN